MCSTASYRAGGMERWFVAHGAEDGLTNPEVARVPPAAFDSIRARQLQSQEGTDGVDHVFDVPLALVEPLVGYRHDASIDDSDEDMFAFALPHRLHRPKKAQSTKSGTITRCFFRQARPSA